jgi:hypothetical protein
MKIFKLLISASLMVALSITVSAQHEYSLCVSHNRVHSFKTVNVQSEKPIFTNEDGYYRYYPNQTSYGRYAA